jgi:hypothetical protein
MPFPFDCFEGFDFFAFAFLGLGKVDYRLLFWAAQPARPEV